MIVHFILHGETLESISEEIKLENPKYLKEYHNQRCAREDYINDELIPRKKLLIPELKDIQGYNAKNDAPFKHPKRNPTLSFNPENFSQIYNVTITETTENEEKTKSNSISFTVSLKWIKKDIYYHIFHLFKNNFYDQSGSKMGDLAIECIQSLHPIEIKTNAKGEVLNVSLKEETIENFKSIKEKLLDFFPDQYAKIYIDEFERVVLDQDLFNQRMKDDVFIKFYFAPFRTEFINGKSYYKQTIGEDNFQIDIHQQVESENYSQEMTLLQNIQSSDPKINYHGKYIVDTEYGLIENINAEYNISQYSVKYMTKVSIQPKL